MHLLLCHLVKGKSFSANVPNLLETLQTAESVSIFVYLFVSAVIYVNVVFCRLFNGNNSCESEQICIFMRISPTALKSAAASDKIWQQRQLPTISH